MLLAASQPHPNRVLERCARTVCDRPLLR
jgi:hypothetical protein